MSARDLTSSDSAKRCFLPSSDHVLSWIEWADKLNKPDLARFKRHPAALVLPSGVAVATMTARDLTSPDSARRCFLPLSDHVLSWIEWADKFDKPDIARLQRHPAAAVLPSGVAVATISARDLTNPDSARRYFLPSSNHVLSWIEWADNFDKPDTASF
jgi:hypothetical protein